MADEALTETSVELPPQATGNSLPGMAADLADIAKAPSQEDALLAANFGDKGVDQYRALQAAGQQAPAPAAPTGLAGLAGPTGPTSAPAAPTAGGNLSDPLIGILQGLAGGGPNAGATMVANRQQAQQQAQEHAQKMAVADATFLHNLRDQPLNMRAAMIQAYAAKQGRELMPSEAMYVANIKPDVIEHTIERAKTGDVLALEQMQSIFSGDPMKMVQAATTMRKTEADADKSINDAINSGMKLGSDAEKYGLDIAAKIRKLQVPPTPNETRVLDAAGLEAVQVPVTGAPGATMWSTRPKAGGAAGTGAVVDVTKMNEAENKAAAGKALAKEKATTTAATRTMRETAPKVRELANELDNALTSIETGPFKGRLQDFMSGKIGAPNPAFREYKVNADLLSSLIMRMHVGARSSDKIGAKFDEMIGANKQSPENMKAALKAIRRYADIVEHAREGDEVDVPDVTAGGKGASGAALAKPSTPEEAAALPSGTQFIWTDGSTRTRK